MNLKKVALITAGILTGLIIPYGIVYGIYKFFEWLFRGPDMAEWSRPPSEPITPEDMENIRKAREADLEKVNKEFEVWKTIASRAKGFFWRSEDPKELTDIQSPETGIRVLPPEILEHAVSFLSPLDIRRAAGTSKAFAELAESHIPNTLYKDSPDVTLFYQLNRVPSVNIYIHVYKEHPEILKSGSYVSDPEGLLMELQFRRNNGLIDKKRLNPYFEEQMNGLKKYVEWRNANLSSIKEKPETKEENGDLDDDSSPMNRLD